MRKIHITDVLFATIMQHGRTIYTARICGVTSMSEIVKIISSNMGTIMGMFTLNLRNGSQGWSTSSSLRLQRA
ncbi:MAG: hypothetical protein K2L93_06440 [Muribaculaceae bacterium]|nr:hypothetical protein [Muribaculaceae bacterium]MDE6321924.1 hypothetical protein [Muribaculaceae bacterium]